MVPGKLTSRDPVLVSIHFHKTVTTIFNDLVCSKSTPIFGKVKYNFRCIEYEARGAPNVHCIFWIEDSPVIGKSTVAEVIQ